MLSLEGACRRAEGLSSRGGFVPVDRWIMGRASLPTFHGSEAKPALGLCSWPPESPSQPAWDALWTEVPRRGGVQSKCTSWGSSSSGSAWWADSWSFSPFPPLPSACSYGSGPPVREMLPGAQLLSTVKRGHAFRTSGRLRWCLFRAFLRGVL